MSPRVDVLDLRSYISTTVLPSIFMGTRAVADDASEKKKKTALRRLTVYLDETRILQSMYVINIQQFKSIVKDFYDKCIPGAPARSTRSKKGKRSKTAAAASAGVSLVDMKEMLGELSPVHDLKSLSDWIHAMPLTAAQQVMHHVWPTTTDWSFTVVEKADADASVFRYHLWHNEKLGKNSVLVAFQPHWILQMEDLTEFVHCASMTPRKEWRRQPYSRAQRQPYSRAQRLWAKLWDTCKKRDCSYFVLSTFKGWVFGFFSPGWTKGYVSPAIASDSKGPTVIECLVHWLAAGTGIPKGWETPNVAEDIPYHHREVPWTVYDARMGNFFKPSQLSRRS